MKLFFNLKITLVFMVYLLPFFVSILLIGTVSCFLRILTYFLQQSYDYCTNILYRFTYFKNWFILPASNYIQET